MPYIPELNEIIKSLDKWAPEETAFDWDPVGLQIGNPSQKIGKIMTTLEISPLSFEEAVTEKVDLIVSHHPLFMDPIIKFDSASPLHKLISRCIERKISVYVMHTNLDGADDSFNSFIKKKFTLKNTSPVQVYPSPRNPELKCNLGIIGIIPRKMPFNDIIEKVEKIFNCRCNAVPAGKKHVRRLAFAPGSGGKLVEDAYRLKADVLITGDIKHPHARLAELLGFALIDYGHFESEYVYTDILYRKLKKTISRKKWNTTVFRTTRLFSPYSNPAGQGAVN